MIVNKVAASGLKVLDLEDLMTSQPIVEFDISPYLFKGIVLKEKEFRKSLKEIDWSAYNGQLVTIYCSTDAIIPLWAYMLITSYLIPQTTQVFHGNKQAVEEELLLIGINGINIDVYKDERVIIKGCGKLEKSGQAYIAVTKKLLPIVKSLMFGEACSTVPIYKKK